MIDTNMIQKAFKRKKFVFPGINSDAFTLIEMLASIALFSILGVAIATIFFRLNTGTMVQQVTSGVIQKGRAALEVMEEDIKRAGLDTEATGRFSIIAADTTATSFRFRCDTIVRDLGPDGISGTADDRVRGNGTFDVRLPGPAVTDGPPEDITYRFIAGRLERVLNLGQTSTRTEVLLPSVNMANCSFAYLTQTGTATVDPNQIVFVAITLGVREIAGSRGPIDRILTSRVFCRNLLFNAQRRANT